MNEGLIIEEHIACINRLHMLYQSTQEITELFEQNNNYNNEALAVGYLHLLGICVKKLLGIVVNSAAYKSSAHNFIYQGLDIEKERGYCTIEALNLKRAVDEFAKNGYKGDILLDNIRLCTSQLVSYTEQYDNLDDPEIPTGLPFTKPLDRGLRVDGGHTPSGE